MFCHTDVILAYRDNHHIWMVFSYCQDFADHSKEVCCNQFFAMKSNIFSLLNCLAFIKKYGSLGGIWEGEDKMFVRCVKLKISTMRYQTSHLLPPLVRLLNTKTLSYLNPNNPQDKCKAYSRTNNVTVYSKRTSCTESTMTLK